MKNVVENKVYKIRIAWQPKLSEMRFRRLVEDCVLVEGYEIQSLYRSWMFGNYKSIKLVVLQKTWNEIYSM